MLKEAEWPGLKQIRDTLYKIGEGQPVRESEVEPLRDLVRAASAVVENKNSPYDDLRYAVGRLEMIFV